MASSNCVYASSTFLCSCSFKPRAKASRASFFSFLVATQLMPPGTPLPHERGTPVERSSPLANADEASVNDRRPDAKMKVNRRICVILARFRTVRNTRSSLVPSVTTVPRTRESPNLATGTNRRDEACYESISRSILLARPDASSHSITTAHNRASPVAGSNRTGIPFKNLPTTNSFLTPITPS